MSDLHTNGTANRAPTGAQDDIVERLRNWDDGRVSTHYEGCWDSHPVCAMLLAADAIEARDDNIERLRAEIERLRRRVERFNIALADLEHLTTERAVLHRIKEARRG
jgi:hypothetical protein